MRVTGGIGKGQKLKVPSGLRVRPTSDKVKQALFNILGRKILGASFLDLYAGAGGIGIEALSRGAERVVFVDDSRASLNAIKQNVAQSGFSERANIIGSRTETFLRKAADEFDIIFLDPPYSVELDPLLAILESSAILKPDSIVVAEHFKKQLSPRKAGRLLLSREARYGDTVLAFYKLSSDG